jgi:hypothetical protein
MSKTENGDVSVMIRELQTDNNQVDTALSDIDSIVNIVEGNTPTEEGNNNSEPTEPLNEGQPQEPEIDNEEGDEQDGEVTPAEPVKTNKRYGVKDALNSLVENGEWEDVSINYGDKTYESISELLENEKPTRELLDSLTAMQAELRKEKFENGYVSVENLDSTRLNLINLIRSGADYAEMLEYHKQEVEPALAIDVNNSSPEEIERFVADCLDRIDGFPAKYIPAEIEELKKNFTLLAKAEEFKKMIVDNYNEQAQLRMQEEQQHQAQLLEDYNNNVRSFGEALKEDNYSDAFIEKATALRYSRDMDGEYHYQKLIRDKFDEDPTFQTKLMHFLLDEEDFIKKATSKAKLENTKRIMTLNHTLPTKTGGKASAEPKVKTEGDDIYESIRAAGGVI